jgi:hypothetical protein
MQDFWYWEFGFLVPLFRRGGFSPKNRGDWL